MKFKNQALAWAWMGSLAPIAFAQSNVQLSGVVDLSVRRSSNSVGHVTSLSSGGNSTSRVQLTGTEDLGGGDSAGFWLEGSLLADTGTGATGSGLIFDRRSTVQLAGRWGELRLGRDWTPVFWGQVYSDPFFATGIGSLATFLNQGVNTAFRRAYGTSPTTLSRSSNAVEYWLPADLGGVYGQVMSSFAEKSGGQSANAQGAYKYDGFRLGWRGQGFDAAVFGGRTRIDASRTGLKQEGLYGAYTFGAGPRLSASVVRSSYIDARQRHTIVGLSIPVQQFVIKAAYNRLDQQGVNERGVRIDRDDAQSLTLGGEFYLSRRSALYATVASLRNRGNATFSVPGGPTAGIRPGSSSRGAELGFRHSF